jgi:CO/xanthine dehydrogenase FAD-binding subunit
MTSLEFIRPSTIEEAVELLKRGIPLAGGTEITPRRRVLQAVIDLSKLGLDQITISESRISIGATTKLQAILESNDLPQTLRDVCRLEAGWNIRNMATIAGVIKTADGRSPLMTVLLAINPDVIYEPGGERINLDAFLDIRDQPQIIRSIEFNTPLDLYYEQVARSPRDYPLVSVALLKQAGTKGEAGVRISLGGFDQRPIQIETMKDDLEGAAHLAKDAYANADDAWASGEYRSHVAEVLVNRLVAKSQE